MIVHGLPGAESALLRGVFQAEARFRRTVRGRVVRRCPDVTTPPGLGLFNFAGLREVLGEGAEVVLVGYLETSRVRSGSRATLYTTGCVFKTGLFRLFGLIAKGSNDEKTKDLCSKQIHN